MKSAITLILALTAFLAKASDSLKIETSKVNKCCGGKNWELILDVLSLDNGLYDCTSSDILPSISDSLDCARGKKGLATYVHLGGSLIWELPYTTYPPSSPYTIKWDKKFTKDLSREHRLRVPMNYFAHLPTNQYRITLLFVDKQGKCIRSNSVSFQIEHKL